MGQTRDEEVVYSTCLFGSDYNSQNVSSYTATWTATNGDFTWTIVNGNNNNNGWSYVKFGRKNNASVGSISTQASYSEAITKVDLTIDAITTNNINSIKLYTSSDNSTWTEAGAFDKSIGTKTVTLATPSVNLYYKIEFDCASGSSNGLIQISKVEYYHVTSTSTCATPTFSPASGTYMEAQTVTISCATEDATIYYTTDGNEPTTSSSVYSDPIAVNSDMTIKAMATAANYNNSAIATATYTIVEPISGYTIDFESASDLYSDWTFTNMLSQQSGSINTHGGTYYGTTGGKTTASVQTKTAIATPYTLTCYVSKESNNTTASTWYIQVSEDGTTWTDVNTQSASSMDKGVWVEFSATLTAYTNVYVRVYYSGSTAVRNIDDLTLITTVPTTPLINVTEPDEIAYNATEGTLTVTYANITEIEADIYFCDADGEAATYDWITASINTDNNVAYTISANDGEARTAYFKVYVGETYSNLVTVTQAAYVAPATGDKYVKVTSTADLTSGQYLIIYEEGSVAFNGGLETLDATGNTIEVIMNNNKIEVTNATAAAEFTIDVTAGTIKSASGCYIGQTSDANGLLTSTETAYTNTISIDNGNSNIVSSGDAYLRYNSTSGQTRFRYYKSSSYTGQKAIQLYKKVEDTPVTETYTLNITGYTSDDTKDGYYLIASPVTESPSDVAGMTEGDFDLYYYDDAEELEWRNYEDTPFNLVPGKGYLYAKKATTETPSYQFTLTGTLYTGEGEIELAEGWNLVGNPFGVEAEISMDYYALNPTATELIATSADNNNVAALQGVFVNKTQGTTSVIFVEADNGTNNGESKVVMNVTRNRGNVIDRAIVRFGEGQQLLKFQLNPNNTKIYVTEGNQDYAIVRSANEGEMPVSFKAAENGTYSFSVEAENVEMNYLHLIDNMTGMDVDLLQTPSYTFEAKTSDYASRFRLVFNANENGASEGSASFAFFNGTNWTVSNMGEATLQVLDMTGCVLSSETISGNAEINLNQPVGVYMLRMVNGNNVKVQKIVVK